ncbi:MAG: hypothetical protein ACOY3Y_00480 [Acidobacteriota bacterium]
MPLIPGSCAGPAPRTTSPETSTGPLIPEALPVEGLSAKIA